MSWLRNIQGQLSELANDVLNEMTEVPELSGTTKKTETLELLSDVQKQLETLSNQKDQEIISITEQHSQALQELRENYENKLRNLEALSLVSTDQSANKIIEEELKREKAANKFLEDELSHLKVKLAHIEETTAEKTTEAEKRENDLRALITDLQISHEAVMEQAKEHSTSLEIRIADMTLRLEEAEKMWQLYKSRAEHEEEMRLETAEALKSIQDVLREISSDHEKESAFLKCANTDLNSQVATLSASNIDLKNEVEYLRSEKQSLENEVETALRDTVKKQRIIDDLESQIEELKIFTAKEDQSEYRIDDATLRNLFLSYFLATDDKKPDIAILLANILQYSKEDIEKISSSFSHNRISLFDGVIANAGGFSSFTEQFVRFLEIESESSSVMVSETGASATARAPHLDKN